MNRRPPRSTPFPAPTLFRPERLLRGPVAHELDPLQQPLAADVADHPVLARQPLEAPPQLLPPGADVGAQVPLQDLAEHGRSEEHTSELQSRQYLVCRLLLEK